MRFSSLSFFLILAFHNYNVTMDYNNRLLLEARYNPQKVSDLIKYNGVPADLTDPSTGNTPLHVAAEYGKADIISCLVAHGAQLEHKNKKGYIPLHLAVVNGNYACVKTLLDYGSTANVRAKNKNTPLHCAVARGDKDLVKLLLDYGANPNAPDKKGSTPFYKAAASNYFDIVRLLETGRNNSMTKSLSSLIQHNNKKYYLLKHSIYFSEHEYNINRIFIAVKEKKHSEISQLLNCQIPINIRDSNGNTPLHYAVANSDFFTICSLLKAGADPTIWNNEGLNPIQYIFKTGTNLNEIVRFFIQISSVTSLQLFKAVRKSQRSSAEILLKYASTPFVENNTSNNNSIAPKSPIYSRDPSGNNLLHIAALGDSPRLVKILINNYKLDPRTKNYSRMSAINFAANRKKNIASPASVTIYDSLNKAAISLYEKEDMLLYKKLKSKVDEYEKCCICKEIITEKSRVSLSPCNHNNICKECARINFFPDDKDEKHYQYRQCCPLCRKKVDLDDLEKKLSRSPNMN